MFDGVVCRIKDERFCLKNIFVIIEAQLEDVEFLLDQLKFVSNFRLFHTGMFRLVPFWITKRRREGKEEFQDQKKMYLLEWILLRRPLLGSVANHNDAKDSLIQT